MASIGSLVVNLVARTSQYRRGMRRASQRTAAFGRSAAFAGAQMAALGGAPMGLAIKEATNFQTAMSQVATQLDEVGKQKLPMIADELQKTAVQYNRDAGKMTQGMFDLLSSQIPVNKALEMTKTGAILAAGGFTNMNTAMSVTNTLYQTYGDSLKDAQDAADLLFQTQHRGRGTMEQFAQHMGTFIPVAQNSGAAMHEMAAAFASATQTMGSENIARVATGMRNMFSAFTDVKPGMAKAWSRHFSKPMSKATLQSEGLLSIMEKLATLDSKELAEIFPRKRARQFGVVPILQQLEHFRTSLEEIGAGRGGAAMKAFEERADDAGFAVGRLWKAVKQQARLVGTEYLPALTQTADVLRGWISSHTKLFKIIGSGLAAVAALGTGLMLFGTATWMIGSAVAALQTMIGYVVAIAPAFAAAAIPALAFTSLLAAIGGSIAILATQTTLFQDIWYGVSTAAKAAWNVIAGVFNSVMKAVTTMFPFWTSVFQAIWEWFSTVASNLAKGWGMVIGVLTDESLSWYQTWVKITNMAWRIWDTWTTSAVKAWIDLTDNIVAMGVLAWGQIRSEIALLEGAFKAAWKGIGAAAIVLWDNLKKGAQVAINTIIKGINKVISTINSITGTDIAEIARVKFDIGTEGREGEQYQKAVDAWENAQKKAGAIREEAQKSAAQEFAEGTKVKTGLDKAMERNERKRQKRLKDAMGSGGEDAGKKAGKTMREKLSGLMDKLTGGGAGAGISEGVRQATLTAVKQGTAEAYKARIRRHTANDPNVRTAQAAEELVKMRKKEQKRPSRKPKVTEL